MGSQGMKILTRMTIASFAIWAVLLLPQFSWASGPVDNIPEKSHCPVCGMFIAKYPDWVTEIATDKETLFFDGTKDMFVFYFNPAQFDGPSQKDLKEIWVKDYYSLDWIDGRLAYYVVGSDVYGPMGHELIPFSSKDAAESFKNDHKGKAIYRFEEITPDLIESLRHGQRMR